MEILIFTIYHPQIDKQSKKNNQIIEIALRYFIIINLEID